MADVAALADHCTRVPDNLSVHKSASAGQLGDAAGRRLDYVAMCLPDLAPTEPAFAKPKGRPRRAEAHSFDALADVEGAAYPTITVQHRRGFYRNAGYPL